MIGLIIMLLETPTISDPLLLSLIVIWHVDQILYLLLSPWFSFHFLLSILFSLGNSIKDTHAKSLDSWMHLAMLASWTFINAHVYTYYIHEYEFVFIK